MKRIQNLVGKYTEGRIKKHIFKMKEGQKSLCVNNEKLGGELEIRLDKWDKCGETEFKRKLSGLRTLDLSSNNLTSLKIVGLDNLEHLLCNFNKLWELEIIDCPKLKELSCSHNKLTNIKVVKEISEEEKDTNEKSIILSEKNEKNLIHLDISDNNFTPESLKSLQHFTNLEYLYLENWDKKKMEKERNYNHFEGSLKHLWKLTKLKELNISNTDIYDGLEYLPDELRVVCVSNKKEESKSKIIQEQLEEYSDNLQELKKSRYPAQVWLDKYYPKEKKEEIDELNIEGKNLEGSLKLEGFINLKLLVCSWNKLSELDISNCHKLEKIICHRNKLTNLDVSNNQELKVINCSDNELTNLDVSNCKNLEELNCGINQLTNLNLGGKDNLTELKRFRCNDNFLSKLDFSFLKNPDRLIYLNIKNNNFPSDFPNNNDLFIFSDKLNPDSGTLLFGNDDEKIFLKVDAQKWLERNYPKETRKEVKELNFDLEELRKKNLLSENDILFGSLSLENFYNLQVFSCHNNWLKELNIRDSRNLIVIDLDCSDIKNLTCVNSQLTNLKLDKCDKLVSLRVNNNQLIDTSFLIHNLTELYISNNKFFPQTLSFLIGLNNLEKLDLSNNSFYGSLKPLKDMNNLEMLNIRETNIDRGWKHLPKHLLFCYHSLEGKKKELLEKQIFDNLLELKKEFEKKLVDNLKPLSRVEERKGELESKISMEELLEELQELQTQIEQPSK